MQGIRRAVSDAGSEAPITSRAIDVTELVFRPDLMIRWDDETAYGPTPGCARPAALAVRPVRSSPRR